MTHLQAVRGTQDFLGDAARRLRHVTDVFYALSARHGLQPVEVPLFEFTQLFARGIGETADVVSKEMYSFEDRGGESLTLRPEFTAGLARAYISNGWQQLSPLKLATHGPVFRYERPQKGRYRQFHQIDAEIIGVAEPQADIELITLAQDLLETLGVADKVVLQLNTLGDAASRVAWREALVAYFSRHKDALSPDSLTRLERNPLRILDSKNAGDQALCADAPQIAAYLSSEAGQFFESVCRGLDSVGAAYTHSPALVRGLDYYTHTAFEFVTQSLGAQGTVIGGGRYDGLMRHLGGPDTPAVGWAGGLERLALMLDTPPAPPPAIALLVVGAQVEQAGLALAARLRRAGFAIDQGYRGNLKKKLQRANAAGAQIALILGDEEGERGDILLKNLVTGSQTAIALDAVEAALHTTLATLSPVTEVPQS